MYVGDCVQRMPSPLLAKTVVCRSDQCQFVGCFWLPYSTADSSLDTSCQAALCVFQVGLSQAVGLDGSTSKAVVKYLCSRIQFWGSLVVVVGLGRTSALGRTMQINVSIGAFNAIWILCPYRGMVYQCVPMGTRLL